MPRKKVPIELNQRIKGTKLTVIKETEPRGKYRRFLCQCDCGSEPTVVYLSDLLNGNTKSCGCLRYASNRARKRVRKKEVNFRPFGARKVNMTGEKYGMLTVLIEAAPIDGKQRYWWCSCECGNDPVLKSQSYLRTKSIKMESKSCGCKSPGLSHFEPNQRVPNSRLTIIREVERKNGQRRWLCQCDCGSEPKAIYQHSLAHGLTKSCGCLLSEKSSEPTPDAVREKMKIAQGTSKYNRKVRSDNKTGFKGVVYNKKTHKYGAYLIINGKQIWGGSFDTLKEAVLCRKELLEKHLPEKFESGNTCLLCGGEKENNEEFCSYRCHDIYFQHE